MTFVPVLIAIAVTVVWIGIAHAVRNESRRRLGDDVREIPLYRRWTRWARWLTMGMAVALPAALVVSWFANGARDGDEIALRLLQSLWFLGISLSIERANVLRVGSNGFFHSRETMIPWSDVRSVVWDRDLGQRQWGVTLELQRGNRTERLRLWVQRDRQSEAADVFERYAGAAARAQDGVEAGAPETDAAGAERRA
jgi:hypothetical protein